MQSSFLTKMILSSPIFCFYSQFHPEKNMFEWAPWHTSIPHSRYSQQSQSWSWLLSAVDVARGEKYLLSNIWSGRPPACRFTWWSTLWRRRGRVPISFPQGGRQSEMMTTNKIKMIVLAHPIILTLIRDWFKCWCKLTLANVISGQWRRSTWSTTTDPTSPAKRTLIADSLKSIFFK